MPAHGKPVNFKKVKPKKIGYIGSTIHRGTRLVSTKQHVLLEARKLPHTHVYRTKNRRIRRKRVYPKGR